MQLSARNKLSATVTKVTRGEAIANVENQTVHLSVAQRDVAGKGWGQPPRDEDAPTSSPEADLHRHV